MTAMLPLAQAGILSGGTPPADRASRNYGITTLLHYAERVSRRDDNSIEYWQDFVSTFYAAGSIARDDVVMKLALWNAQYGENRTFELNATLLARYYKIIFDSGIKDLVLLIENPKEYFSLGMMLVDCPRASMVYTFDNDVQVVSRGHLRVTFTSQGTIQLWEFHTKQHTEMLPRPIVEALMRQAEGGASITLPPSPVNEFGISIKMMRCLEIAEVVSHMSELMTFSIETSQGPLACLHTFAASMLEEKERLRAARAAAGMEGPLSATSVPGTPDVSTPQLMAHQQAPSTPQEAARTESPEPASTSRGSTPAGGAQSTAGKKRAAKGGSATTRRARTSSTGASTPDPARS